MKTIHARWAAALSLSMALVTLVPAAHTNAMGAEVLSVDGAAEEQVLTVEGESSAEDTVALVNEGASADASPADTEAVVLSTAGPGPSIPKPDPTFPGPKVPEPSMPDASGQDKANATDAPEADGNGVRYIERYWEDGQLKERNASAKATSYTGQLELTSGTYAVDHDVTVSNYPTVKGDVKIILCDGATLTAKDGIFIPKGSTLTIYGQQGGSGKIVAEPGSGPGIGAVNKTAGGRLVIHGGTIVAHGGKNGAGLGGANKGATMESIEIYGGDIDARGGNYGAGIGGGNDGSAGSVAIHGGKLSVEGGKEGAGIGGGEDGNGGDITITGGMLKVKAGSKAAGIGGGENRDGGNITISGGELHVESGDGAAIGGGEDGRGGTTTITGGTFTLSSSCGAGIGGGNHGENGGTVNISGGTFTIKSEHSPGIGGGRGNTGFFAGNSESGDGGNITISGGTLDITADHSGAIGAGGPSSGDFDGAALGASGNIRISGGDLTLRCHDKAGAISGDTGHFVLTGGAVKCPGCTYAIRNVGKADIEIHGGRLDGGVISTMEDVIIDGGEVLLDSTAHKLRSITADSITLGGVCVESGSSLYELDFVKVGDRVSTLEKNTKQLVRVASCLHVGAECTQLGPEYHIVNSCPHCGCVGDKDEPHVMDGHGACIVCGYTESFHITSQMHKEGGRVFVNGATARPGEKLTLKAMADAGWELVAAHVVTASGTEVKLTETTPKDAAADTRAFTFTMPHEDVKLSGDWQKMSSEDQPKDEGQDEQPVEPDFTQAQYGVSLILDQRIGVDFCASKLPEGMKAGDVTVRYWTGDEESAAQEMALETPGSCRVRIADLAAKDVDMPVHARVFLAGQDEPVKELDCSVRDYCEKQIASGDALAGSLCRAVLDYGICAQRCIGGGAKEPLDEAVAARLAGAKVPQSFAAQADGSCSKVSRVAASVSLESQAAVNFYITPMEGASSDQIALAIDGKELKPAGKTAGTAELDCATATCETLSDGRIHVSVSGIATTKLDHAFQLVIGQDGDAKTVSYSVLSYAQSKQYGEDEALADVCRALYSYHMYAKAYAGGHR